jgi:chromosome segregation ATPase
MNKLFYLLLFISISTSFSAQPNFERRIKEIKEDIKIITEMEKEALLIEIENINEQLDKKSITSVEAELQKKAKAEACADRIQSRIAPLEREIQRLVRNEVEGNTDDESMETDAESGAEEIEDYELEMEEMEDFERGRGNYNYDTTPDSDEIIEDEGNYGC